MRLLVGPFREREAVVCLGDTVDGDTVLGSHNGDEEVTAVLDHFHDAEVVRGLQKTLHVVAAHPSDALVRELHNDGQRRLGHTRYQELLSPAAAETTHEQCAVLGLG